MKRLRRILFRGITMGVLAAVLGAGALLVYVSWYTQSDRILPGVTVGLTPIGGLQPGDAHTLLTRPLAEVTKLKWEERVWTLDWREIEVDPDVPGALRTASALGRSGTVWRRTQTFLGAIVHGHYIPMEPRLQERVIWQRLQAIASEIDSAPRNAQYDFQSDTLTEEASGRRLDVDQNLRIVRTAVLAGISEVDLSVELVKPEVTRALLAHVRRHLLARFTTPILAADGGRVHNIAMAVQRISGVLLKPGQDFSFNDVVGPRDSGHGWAQAKELYQGEFVWGFGGGICQVSSTLYNSVLLSGLVVRQRFHHDRPLQYVAPGRDATVAWDVLDFRFRNNLTSSVLIGARIIAGTPQQIEVALYTPNPEPKVRIDLEETDVRYFPPPLNEIMDARLPSGRRQVVDEGHYGMEVKIYRVFRGDSRERRELVSHDQYLPKPGKVLVGIGNAPGAEKLLNPGLR